MSLMGYEMGSLLNFAMPLEWRTFSIVGGQPWLDFIDVDTPPAELAPRTNKFGHFHDFYCSTNNKTIDQQQSDARSHSIVRSDQYLSVPGCNEYDVRSRRTVLETHYFPSQGLTIISDVDDILRGAEIWNPKQMIFNTFVRPFQPWLDMNRIYRD
jgi:hypothetical protein